MNAPLDAQGHRAGQGPALSNLPLYLLVDPYFREPRAANMDTRGEPGIDELRSRREQAWERAVCMADEPPPRIAPAQAPYLVALDGSDDPLLAEAIAEAAQERQAHLREDTGIYSIGGVIEAEMEAEAVMGRMQQLWRVLFKGRPCYLRIGDPRVMALTGHMLAATELQQWLGPIAKWHALSVNGEWMSLSGAADTDLAATEDDLYRRHRLLDELKRTKATFPMTQQREQRLACSEAVSRALYELMRQAMAGERSLPRGFPTRSHYEQAWALCMRARATASAADMADHIARTMAGALTPGE